MTGLASRAVGADLGFANCGVGAGGGHSLLVLLRGRTSEHILHDLHLENFLKKNLFQFIVCNMQIGSIFGEQRQVSGNSRKLLAFVSKCYKGSLSGSLAGSSSAGIRLGASTSVSAHVAVAATSANLGAEQSGSTGVVGIHLFLCRLEKRPAENMLRVAGFSTIYKLSCKSLRDTQSWA
jgi:hypothetical protein